MSGWAIAAGAVVGGVSSYMGAKEQNKAAKEAAKPKPYESHRTPYMNEYLSQYAPWLMAMQQKIFESRLKAYGLDPGQFGLGALGQSLAGINPGYSGVGVASKAPILRHDMAGAQNPFQYALGISPEVPAHLQRPEGVNDQLWARIQAMRASRGQAGGWDGRGGRAISGGM